MRVIIAGSRNITDYELVVQAIKESGFEITQVVCGMARGVDLLGRQYAISNGIQVADFPAQWYQNKVINGQMQRVYVNSAGYIRNVLMADNADALIAVRNSGKSDGTDHMIRIAQSKGLASYVKKYDDSVPGAKEVTLADLLMIS